MWAIVALLLLAACTRDAPADTTQPSTRVQRELERLRDRCEDTVTPGTFPSRFPPVELPEGAELAAPAADPRPGWMRVDLSSTASVREIYDHFVRTFRRSPGFVIVAREYEGFDAEIFFSYGRRLGSVLIVSSCEGAAAAIEVEAGRTAALPRAG